MESFITNETSPDTCTLAHRLQKLPWSIAFQILQCIMGAAASACLPWMIRTHRRCMQCYHGNVYPILVNLHSLTFYHVAALLMRLVFVISRHLSRSDDCGYIYSAFTCHISSQAPKLSFYSLGTNVCALLLEQVAGLYGRLNIHKRRGNVFVALGFVVTYVPTVVQLAQFIYGAIALWQLDISVVYCSPYMNPVPDLAVLEPFIEGVQIGIIVVMVVGASLLGYSLHNIETKRFRRYVPRNQQKLYDEITMKRQMNRSIKATRLVVATGLVFAIILASADIPYWIVAKAPGLSEQTKIYIIEGTAVLVPTFILMFVGVSFYYTKKFHRVSSISAFSPGGVATISHIENTNSKNYGSAYTRHFGRLSGNWNAAYTIAIC